MEKGRVLIETHLRTGRPIGELAKAHDVSRSWLYKLLVRYRREGWAGLEPRSRRPKTSPTRIANLYEDEIIRIRKELIDGGFDAGAETIHFHMATPGRTVPSVATIWRVLKARGFVTPEPHKRPRSSWKRFEAEFPNQCWQADMTHVVVADGVVYEVLNIIDDHSRICIASQVFGVTRAPDVVRTLHRAAETWGYPRSVLTDNGRIFTTPRGQAIGAMESELLALGIAISHGRPYHPQTQGKVERFHQTMKKYLDKQEPATTKKQLQGQLIASSPITTTSDRIERSTDGRLEQPSRPEKKSAPLGRALTFRVTGFASAKSPRAAPSPCATKASFITSELGGLTPAGGSSCWSLDSTSASWASTDRRSAI